MERHGGKYKTKHPWDPSAFVAITTPSVHGPTQRRSQIVNLEEMVLEQKKKLDETRERFMQVNQGIGECKNETSAVNIKTEECNRDCNEIVETIESLSAISEQNAASAEETTASMQELNATITKLADDAGTLKDLAGDLTEAMKYFEL